MLTDDEKNAIRDTWKLVVPIVDTAAELFYQRLFELQPGYRAMFKPDLAGQQSKYFKMMTFIVDALDWPASDWKVVPEPGVDLGLVVLAMGRRHGILYDVPETSYGPMGEALMWTLHEAMGAAYTDQVDRAWRKLYRLVADAMMVGAKAGHVDLGIGLIADPPVPEEQPS